MTHKTKPVSSVPLKSHMPHTPWHILHPRSSPHNYVSYVHLTMAAAAPPPPPASPQFAWSKPSVANCVLCVYRKMLLLVFSLDRKKSLPLTELFHGCQKCKLLITGNSGTGTGNFGVRINLVMLNVIRVAIVWICWAYMKLQLILAVVYSASW